MGWWRLDENTGSTTTADSSGNGNTGSFIPTGGGYTIWAPGISGSGFFGNGYNYVTTTIASSLNLTTQGTLAVWEKASASAGTYVPIMGNGCWTYDMNGYYLGFTPGGGIDAEVANASGDDLSEGAFSAGPTGPYDNGQWHHLVFTWNKIGTNTGKVYADGIILGSFNITENAVSGAYPFTIGAVGANTCGGGSFFFSGTLDDARVYNRALSASEIAVMYSQGLSGTPMIEGPGPSIVYGSRKEI
jgi:hypothetical protein